MTSPGSVASVTGGMTSSRPPSGIGMTSSRPPAGSGPPEIKHELVYERGVGSQNGHLAVTIAECRVGITIDDRFL